MELEEMKWELWENMVDLAGELLALECVGNASAGDACGVRAAYLRRGLCYVEQYTKEIYTLARLMTEKSAGA